MMIEFTIHGNHEDPECGHPLPKLRKTRQQQWTPEAKRYVEWKEYVLASFLKSETNLKTALITSHNLQAYRKPFDATKRKAIMSLKIYWHNRAHGDPENIFGSIADALFIDDRNLDGDFQSELSKDGKSRVEVKITFQ